jgi:hypothetical protein
MGHLSSYFQIRLWPGSVSVLCRDSRIARVDVEYPAVTSSQNLGIPLAVSTRPVLVNFLPNGQYDSQRRSSKYGVPLVLEITAVFGTMLHGDDVL